MTKRREEEKKIEKVAGSDNTVLNKIYIVLGVLAFIFIFYLLTLYLTSREDNSNVTQPEVSEEAIISYDEIVLGRSLTMDEAEYLVLYYDKGEEKINSKYSVLVTDYKGKEESLKIYTVDMSSVFNRGFKTDKESNKNPKNAEEMLINGPTLIKVKDNSVSEYFEGEDEITDYLK